MTFRILIPWPGINSHLQQWKHRVSITGMPENSLKLLFLLLLEMRLLQNAKKCHWKRATRGTSLVVEWLSLYASTAGGTGWIPVWGTKIPHAAWYSQKQQRALKLKRTFSINCFGIQLRFYKSRLPLPLKTIFSEKEQFNLWWHPMCLKMVTW